MYKILFLLSIILIVSSTPLVFAQEVPGDLPITVTSSDLIIVGIGILGGLTTAGLGIAKNKNKVDANKKLIQKASDEKASSGLIATLDQELETKLKFDASKFGRTLLVSVITSILLAAGASIAFTELNPITMIMIYATAMGMSSLSKPGNK